MKTGISNIVSKGELSKQFEEIVEGEMARLVKSEVRSSFHTSEISSCSRKILYNCSRKSEDNLVLQKFNNKFVIDKWFKLLTYYSRGKNIVLSDCNYNLVGNGDIMLEVDYSNILLKIKSVSDEDFQKVLSKGPSNKDVLELMTNEWLAEVNKGILIYENRKDFKFETFQVHLFAPIIESVKTKCKELMAFGITGKMPAHPYKSNSSYECKDCNYIKECWAN